MKNLLISVHPQYVELMKQGKKDIELRKQMPRQEFDKLLIYNTGTQQIELSAKIEAIIRIANHAKNTQLAFGELLQERIGVNKDEFLKYIGEKDFYYLFLKDIQELKPISLKQMQEKAIRPPQGYLYIESKLFKLKCK